MLDRQLNAVLTVLNDFSDGAYKIIDADEIGLATEEGLVLPQGCTAFATFEK